MNSRSAMAVRRREVCAVLIPILSRMRREVHPNERRLDDKKAPLRGLKVCITGIDLDLRQQHAALVRALGGEFHPRLTKRVTHLVAGRKHGEKYDFAIANDVAVVSPAWLRRNVRRRKPMDEAFHTTPDQHSDDSPSSSETDDYEDEWTRLAQSCRDPRLLLPPPSTSQNAS